jgi:hypothetical protein
MEGFLNKKYGIFQKTGKTPFVDYFELEEQHFMDFALLPTPHRNSLATIFKKMLII